MPSRLLSGNYPVQMGGRVLLVLWGVFLCSGFLLARCLEPDPRGFGTHQRMGFPPCTFRAITGLPCPSCGMTTCFAHYTRGHWQQAMNANASGVLLALICTVLIPWSWWSAARGSLVGISRPGQTALGLMLTFIGICLAYWIVQIWSQDHTPPGVPSSRTSVYVSTRDAGSPFCSRSRFCSPRAAAKSSSAC